MVRYDIFTPSAYFCNTLWLRSANIAKYKPPSRLQYAGGLIDLIVYSACFRYRTISLTVSLIPSAYSNQILQTDASQPIGVPQCSRDRLASSIPPNRRERIVLMNDYSTDSEKLISSYSIPYHYLVRGEDPMTFIELLTRIIEKVTISFVEFMTG